MPDAERPYKAFGYPVLPAFFVLFSMFFVGFSIWYNVRNAVFGLLLVAIGIRCIFISGKGKLRQKHKVSISSSCFRGCL
jgi:APA family basic amino acid/polyamine antiporter